KLLLLLLDLPLLLHLRHADEILPADQHERRQRDGKESVLLIGHVRSWSLVPAWEVSDEAVSTGPPGPRSRLRSGCPLLRRSVPPGPRARSLPCTRESACWKSRASRSNGRSSAARRPIST